jgi:fumarylacetoacetase
VSERHGDATTDPGLRSWLPVADGSDFPIQNLPFGAFVRAGESKARLGVALGDKIVDLRSLARAGLLDGVLPDALEVFSQPDLNAFLGRGRVAWRALRTRLSCLLSVGLAEMQAAALAERALVAQSDVQMRLPLRVGDYVDFYSSLEHATNLGKILRPGGEPLLPNWRWIPIGYHGRANTIVVSGTPVTRPHGQRKAAEATGPDFGPSRMLDFELELAFVTGDGPPQGTPLPAARAADHIFGVALLNDWSARDLQAWEYQPLGPFLGKSFATSLAPWIVTMDALEPFRVRGPAQEPAPLPYLALEGPQNYDIALEVDLGPHRIARTNFRDMYWSMPQQLAHLASNGARVAAGDLNASGTISGSAPSSYGSLIELTWRGTKPLELPDGTKRGFLEDGDCVTMRGWCERSGAVRIGLGAVTGHVTAAP